MRVKAIRGEREREGKRGTGFRVAEFGPVAPLRSPVLSGGTSDLLVIRGLLTLSF